jgi:hypothetical protein
MQHSTETTERSFNSLLAENRPSFLRRTDLTPYLRLYIAYTALMANILNSWGTITELSRQFQISRTFVYMLASKLDVT